MLVHIQKSAPLSCGRRVVLVGVVLMVLILLWTIVLEMLVLVSDIPVSSPQYCDNDLILHVAMAYTVNLRQYYGHTGAEWLARNKGKHAAVHSARVGVPLCTGRQPSRNGRVRETSENMELSIPRGLAPRCATARLNAFSKSFKKKRKATAPYL